MGCREASQAWVCPDARRSAGASTSPVTKTPFVASRAAPVAGVAPDVLAPTASTHLTFASASAVPHSVLPTIGEVADATRIGCRLQDSAEAAGRASKAEVCLRPCDDRRPPNACLPAATTNRDHATPRQPDAHGRSIYLIMRG
jgi:hypothetical protein